VNDKLRILVPHERIADFCRRHQIAGLWVFGSALRDDFGPDSDIDVLVSFQPTVRPSISGLIAMEDELSEILRRKVDLVEREAVERSPNYIRRRNILSSLQPIHAAG